MSPASNLSVHQKHPPGAKAHTSLLVPPAFERPRLVDLNALTSIERNYTITKLPRIAGQTHIGGMTFKADKPETDLQLVFSHGIWGRKEVFQYLMHALANKGITCHSLDLLGHGESDGTAKKNFVWDLAQGLNLGIQRLKIGRKNIIPVTWSASSAAVDLLVQEGLEVRAIIDIARIPPISGVKSAAWEYSKAYKATVARSWIKRDLGELMKDPDMAAELLFSTSPEDPNAARFLVGSKVGGSSPIGIAENEFFSAPESMLAYAQICFWGKFIDLEKINARGIPRMVIGFKNDAILTREDHSECISALNARFKFELPGPHAAMLTPHYTHMIPAFDQFLHYCALGS
jgi:pimeloyl-ACP methyl ester carboxylesterase